MLEEVLAYATGTYYTPEQVRAWAAKKLAGENILESVFWYKPSDTEDYEPAVLRGDKSGVTVHLNREPYTARLEDCVGKFMGPIPRPH